jgi:8-oxo-dGTP pyrophosphatase MutT (NUDIX family)
MARLLQQVIDMAVTAQHIRATLTDYLDAHPDQKTQLGPALELLDAGADLSTRSEFRGHATAGAILANDNGRVLHIRHLALNRWLLPGGHLEDSDMSLLDAARRELTEETGIPAAAITPAGDQPLHVDIHPIPANHTKGEPDHQHIDFRFLFHTAADTINLQTEEVTDGAWLDPATIADVYLRERTTDVLR